MITALSMEPITMSTDWDLRRGMLRRPRRSITRFLHARMPTTSMMARKAISMVAADGRSSIGRRAHPWFTCPSAPGPCAAPGCGGSCAVIHHPAVLHAHDAVGPVAHILTVGHH